MNIKPMIAALGVSCALLAAPAFAQSSATKAEDYAKDKAVKEMKDQVKDKTTEMASDKAADVKHDMKKDHTLVITTSDSIVSVNDEGTTVMDKAAVIAPAEDGMIIDNSKMVKEVDDDMTTTPVITEIACPAGTTAQSNGTCMITGEYQE